MLLSMIYFPISMSIYSVILFKLLKKFTKYPNKKCIIICLLMLLLMPFYGYIFVHCYDSLGVTWAKLKYLFIRLFKKNIYT